MQRKLEVYLWEVRKFSDEIGTFTQGKTLDEFRADRGLKLITEQLFTLLGEVMVRLRRAYPTDYLLITHAPPVARFRNSLVHEYDRMLDEEVWRVITTQLPAMMAEIDKMLSEQQP